jgi:hypothetical protein
MAKLKTGVGTQLKTKKTALFFDRDFFSSVNFVGLAKNKSLLMVLSKESETLSMVN